jgi:hypothetical protein
MKVDLEDLKNNPTRDFRIDPIDNAAVERLKKSIKEDGFWGGVVCRKKNDSIEIAAGHHRVKAALAAGLKEADVFVRTDVSDVDMIRIYARENATHRGNSSTAMAGSVASSVRYLAKIILLNQSGRIDDDHLVISSSELKRLRRNIANNEGLGRQIVCSFLKDVPGVNDRSVQQQLAVLKDSGEYARIIAEVRDAIAVESQDEETVATANRAVEASARREVTFDFEGVSQHLNNPHQVEMFRQSVVNNTDVLPVRNQARVAAQLVRQAQQNGGEISGTAIHDLVGSMVSEARGRQRRETESRTVRNIREAQAWEVQVGRAYRSFSKQISNAVDAAEKIVELERRRPRDARPYEVSEFDQIVRDARKLATLVERISR